MPPDLDWHRRVADRALATMALEDDGPPTLFPTSATPDCFVLKCRAECAVCGEMAGGAHCPTVRHGFFCREHCPVCNPKAATA